MKEEVAQQNTIYRRKRLEDALSHVTLKTGGSTCMKMSNFKRKILREGFHNDKIQHASDNNSDGPHEVMMEKVT